MKNLPIPACSSTPLAAPSTLPTRTPSADFWIPLISAYKTFSSPYFPRRRQTVRVRGPRPRLDEHIVHLGRPLRVDDISGGLRHLHFGEALLQESGKLLERLAKDARRLP